MASIESAEELGLRIREARLGTQRSQAEVAGALGIDRTSVTRIEQGERGVSTLELVALARFFNLPVSYFLERPVEAVTSLRGHLTEDPGVSDRGRFRADALLDARLRTAEFLLDAGVLPRGDKQVAEGAIRTPAHAARMARSARAAIGVRGPVPRLADVCEQFGLFVFVERIGIDGASRSPDRDFGVAIVRDASDPGRRRTTAAHELGHHVMGDAYALDFGAVGATSSDHERLVEAFAAELLLPVTEMTKRRATEPSSDDWEFLVRISAEYRVSWSLALRVASEASVIDERTRRRFSARSPLKADLLRLTGRDVSEDLVHGTYGSAWTRAVMTAHAREIITRARTEELLAGTDPFAVEPNVE